jgi:hypothetical protein
MVSRRGVLLLLGVIVLSGCKPAVPPGGGGTAQRTHEAVVRDAVASVRTVTAAIEGVRDVPTAEQAAQTVRQEVQTLRTLTQELARLGKASDAQRQRAKQHDQAVIDSSRAVQQATAALVARVRPDTYPRDVATKLLTATNDHGAALSEFSQPGMRLIE